MKRSSSRGLANLLRITSAFAFGLAVGVQGAVGVLGLPLPHEESEPAKDAKGKIKPKAKDTTTVSEIVVSVDSQQSVASRKSEPSLLDEGELPTSSIVVAKHGRYASAFDQRLRNPAWACVRLEKRSYDRSIDSDEKADRALSRFRPDSKVPEPYRTKPEDFKATGYDRGHLVAAGDVLKQEDMDDTFLMSNISPQVGAGMNRGFWQMLERFVRKLTFKFDDVYVCSGPLFLPQFDESTNEWMVKYNVIGPNKDIAVPSHFFKCIHATSNSTSSKTCFVVPNRAIDHTKESLAKFEVPIEEVERMAGFQLFPASRRANDSRSVCDQVKCDLLKDQFEGSRRRQALA